MLTTAACRSPQRVVLGLSGDIHDFELGASNANLRRCSYPRYRPSENVRSRSSFVAFQVGRGNVTAPRPPASLYGEVIALECVKSTCLADSSLSSGKLLFVPDVQRAWLCHVRSHRYKRVRWGSSTPSPASWIRAIMEIQPWTRSGSSRSILEQKASVINRGCTIAHILLVFFAFLGGLTGVGAMNLIDCGKVLRAAQEDAQNATNSTRPLPPLRLSYGECVNLCGAGTGDVNWDSFSQSFGAWFLPWIALMFQIPFGSECM